MDASFDRDSPLRELVPGRFTRVSVQTPAGEIARFQSKAHFPARFVVAGRCALSTTPTVGRT